MKNKVMAIVFFILMICTFIIIFIFSSQDGSKSSLTSKVFVKKVIEVLPVTKSLSEVKKKEIVENSQFIIRKLAHFSIYTIAGLTIMGFMNTLKRVNKKKMIYLTLIIGILYAISDEIHQMFSDGRTPKFLDVIVDSVGIIVGIIIFLLIYKLTKKTKIYMNKS